MKNILYIFIVLFVSAILIGCSPAPFLALGDDNVNSPGSRMKENVTAIFSNSKMDILNCFIADDTIISIGITRDVLFVNNPDGKLYIARITKPGAHKHTYPYPISIDNCILKENWNDSISDKHLNTLIYSRLTRFSKDSIRIDTLAIKYSNCTGRSKESIQDVVMANVFRLGAAYSRRTVKGFNRTGRVSVKFAIDEFGRIVFCKIIDSTLNLPNFEKEIVFIVSKWKFPEIIKPGDITEIIYQFNFSL